MRKGEIYTGIVEKVDFPNKGILHIEDEKVVVKNVLPGQTVEVVVTKQKTGKCEDVSYTHLTLTTSDPV